MESIRWPSSPGSGSTKDTAFIQYVDGRQPHIHEVWSLGLDGIIYEVHPTAQEEFIAGTFREFLIDYLAENGRRIQIIGQLSINDSIQFLGVLDQSQGRGLPFPCNLQSSSEATGWGSGHTSNQN